MILARCATNGKLDDMEKSFVTSIDSFVHLPMSSKTLVHTLPCGLVFPSHKRNAPFLQLFPFSSRPSSQYVNVQLRAATNERKMPMPQIAKIQIFLMANALSQWKSASKLHSGFLTWIIVNGLGLRGRQPSNISVAFATSSMSRLSSLDGAPDNWSISKNKIRLNLIVLSVL